MYCFGIVFWVPTFKVQVYADAHPLTRICIQIVRRRGDSI